MPENITSTMSEKIPAEFVRRHHPPDDIIDGKPKWTQIKIRRTETTPQGGVTVSESEIDIDRLNPTRNMVEEIDDNFTEGEVTQKILVNMMADLQTEVVVTLGDTRVDPKLEEQLMAENQKWECYKKKRVIKNWVPLKENVPLAPLFRSVEKKNWVPVKENVPLAPLFRGVEKMSVKKGLKRKSVADPQLEGGLCVRSAKKVKRVPRLPSSPRKTKVMGLNNFPLYAPL
eukprot:GFUD01042173.1.p1 GENE.GFUD01042173.1~~GFUD01042173.1.p1  ORF type:complete len:229 (-),score=72.53 GFUD01042173.1:20-706(-)